MENVSTELIKTTKELMEEENIPQDQFFGFFMYVTERFFVTACKKCKERKAESQKEEP